MSVGGLGVDNLLFRFRFYPSAPEMMTSSPSAMRVTPNTICTRMPNWCAMDMGCFSSRLTLQLNSGGSEKQVMPPAIEPTKLNTTLRLRTIRLGGKNAEERKVSNQPHRHAASQRSCFALVQTDPKLMNATTDAIRM